MFTKMVDYYFKLQKNNCFVMYGRVWGIRKMNEYNGKYIQSNDTLYLTFCSKPMPEELTGKAYFDRLKNEIILQHWDTSYNETYEITKDNRKK